MNLLFSFLCHHSSLIRLTPCLSLLLKEPLTGLPASGFFLLQPILHSKTQIGLAGCPAFSQPFPAPYWSVQSPVFSARSPRPFLSHPLSAALSASSPLAPVIFFPPDMPLRKECTMFPKGEILPLSSHTCSSHTCSSHQLKPITTTNTFTTHQTSTQRRGFRK